LLLESVARPGLKRLLNCTLCCRISRRRGLLSVVFFLIALADVFWGRARPVDFLGTGASPFAVVPWTLTVIAAVVRIWGAGNLRKNQEVTRTGIYSMVRHPLYLGNCLVFLAFFLSFGDPSLGSVLFLVLLFFHYPLMLQEEARLAQEFPREFAACAGTPRLVPDVFAFREALATDRFSLARVHRNYALRSLLAPILLPVLMELLIALRDRL
jgi:protein-S-isoprenylcysteine O-methyltransferase Ste14